MELTARSSVADLAAGTGKLTALLASRVADVVAIEPDHAMRIVLEEGVPQAQVVAGTAEAIPLAEASVDAVFCGDAFHWFDGHRALHEIARILRPGGGLALLWNHWWETEPSLPEGALAALRAPFERAGGEAAVRRIQDWRGAFAGSPFAELEEETIEWSTDVTADRAALLFTTVSTVVSLPDAERNAIGEELRRTLSGTYRLPVRTELYWTRKVGPE